LTYYNEIVIEPLDIKLIQSLETKRVEQKDQKVLAILKALKMPKELKEARSMFESCEIKT
jgi:hypothetical protein